MVGIGLASSSLSYAQDVQLSRYVSASKNIKSYQIDLLSQTVTMQFDHSVKTIQDAIIKVLSLSGYRLAPLEQQSKLSQVMLQNPLPPVFTEINHASIKSVLVGLMGNHFKLVVDPVYRTIGFVPKDAIAGLYKKRGDE